jgi:nucleotide-binding universal stress UspA family protein
MKTIIVPTDFSAAGTNAAYYAADMALAYQTDLLLIHAVNFSVNAPEATASPETYDLAIEGADAQINKLKNELASHVNDKVCINCLVVTDNLISALESISDPAKVFAIVMGIHGSGASARFMFGSNTLAAMRKLHLPLVVVPHQGKFRKIEKLGFACDLHQSLETMPISQIKQLANTFGCGLDILYVSGAEEHLNPAILPESMQLQKTLGEVHPQFHYINDMDIKKGLAAFVDQEAVDLLIVVPRELGIIDALFRKSISKELALHLDVPIMVLHQEKVISPMSV